MTSAASRLEASRASSISCNRVRVQRQIYKTTHKTHTHTHTKTARAISWPQHGLIDVALEYGIIHGLYAHVYGIWTLTRSDVLTLIDPCLEIGRAPVSLDSSRDKDCSTSSSGCSYVDTAAAFAFAAARCWPRLTDMLDSIMSHCHNAQKITRSLGMRDERQLRELHYAVVGSVCWACQTRTIRFVLFLSTKPMNSLTRARTLDSIKSTADVFGAGTMFALWTAYMEE